MGALPSTQPPPAPRRNTEPPKTDPAPVKAAQPKAEQTSTAAKTHVVRAKLAQAGSAAFTALKARNAKKAENVQISGQKKALLDSTSAPFADLTSADTAGPEPLSDDAAGLTASDTGTAKTSNTLNVFGARKTARKTKVKGFRFGLILTAGLIVFLVLVALWASRPGADRPTTADAQKTAEPQTIQTDATGSAATDMAFVPTESDAAGEILDVNTLGAEDLAFEPPLASTDAPLDPEELIRQYVATGIWPLAPEAGSSAPEDSTSDLYIASIDPNILSQDPVALPNALPHHLDALPLPTALPAPAGTTYSFDSRGVVRATPEGAITPSGVRVFSGTPPVVPGVRPSGRTSDQIPVVDTEGDTLRAVLAGFAPRLRPDGLVERSEQANLGGLTRAELGAFRPTARPQSEQQTAQTEAEAEGAAAPAPTAPVVAASLVPRSRPTNIAKLAAAAKAAEEAAAAATGPSGPTTDNASAARVTAAVPAPKIPKGPTATTVAQAATVKNAINLRKVNLMGVYGSNSDRRALVRLPSGRLAKVKVGDRIDGGRVQSISSSALTYVKSGRSHTLKVGG
jgi:type IV pilus biogenesis protein PilP